MSFASDWSLQRAYCIKGKFTSLGVYKGIVLACASDRAQTERLFQTRIWKVSTVVHTIAPTKFSLRYRYGLQILMYSCSNAASSDV